MDKNILNIFKGVTLVFIVLAVILQILVLIKGEEGLAGSSVLDYYAILAYVALGLTVILALIFPVIFIIQNPKNALKILGALVVLVIIGFICYSVAGNTFGIVRLEELKTTAEISRAVGAALYFTYIVGSIAVLTIIYSGIAGLFR